MLRGLHPYYFHLIELMQTVESAYMGAIASGLPAETWGVSGISDREFCFFQNDVPEKIRHRDFCRGNQVEVVLLYMIHLPFFIRELAGSITRGFIDQMGYLNFLIPRFRIAIQKIRDQSALQAGAFAVLYGKAGPGYFDPEFKVDQIVFSRQFPMRKCIGFQGGNLPPLIDDFIICFIRPRRDEIVWGVG